MLAVTNTEWLSNGMMGNSQIVDMDFVTGVTLDRLAGLKGSRLRGSLSTIHSALISARYDMSELTVP